MNTNTDIIKSAIDKELNQYNGLTNIAFELEFNSNMRRYGNAKNNFIFRNTLLYLGIIEDTLKCIQDDTTRI